MDDRVQSVCVMTANDRQELAQIRFLIQSLRAFGGALQHYPVWVFVSEQSEVTPGDFAGLRTEFTH